MVTHTTAFASVLFNAKHAAAIANAFEVEVTHLPAVANGHDAP